MIKNTLLTALAAAAIATPALIAPALVTPAAAEVDLNVVIGTPPPPLRYEVVPAPRAGYVWAPGHWRWDGHQHVWHGGVWVAHRAGYRYVPDRWERYVDNGHERWRYHASSWDRDGDGVPNRYDNHPDNPYRR
jgi:hypothetical protein